MAYAKDGAEGAGLKPIIVAPVIGAAAGIAGINKDELNKVVQDKNNSGGGGTTTGATASRSSTKCLTTPTAKGIGNGRSAKRDNHPRNQNIMYLMKAAVPSQTKSITPRGSRKKSGWIRFWTRFPKKVMIH